jgi:hypothetical protein
MFYELIYTRCRQGIDINKRGHPISSDGYKVYSCSSALFDDGVVDLPFLANAAQAKQPYADPGFMDDAFLYYVPDTGNNFLVGFYPVPFDPKAQGDYSRRPGNFVNHILVGDFTGVYPYEMFNDNNIWNAKTKGEAFYYENPPTALPARKDIDPPSQYGYDDLCAFVADGRKETLAKAVAFFIQQYKEEPENRKYLVIRDESSKNIEMWIAAIESAFSPKVAASIPFATRMDKFVNTNRYTVKLGLYSPQMNLQDPNQKQRYRAMIVGVDERDKTNASATRPLANSPFVVLDGKMKQLSCDGDTSHPYFKLVSKFDDEHLQFCRDFLQSFNVLIPSEDIVDLYEIYSSVSRASLPNARALAGLLGRLSKYQATGTRILKEIYGRIDREVPRFLQEDLSSSLSIINWLLVTSRLVGDNNAKQRLTETVCKVFFDLLISRSDNASKRSCWDMIRRTEFATNVSLAITDMERIKSNAQCFHTFTSADAVTFITVYMEAASLVGNVDIQSIKSIIMASIVVCHRNNDTTALQEIVSKSSQLIRGSTQDLLLSMSKGNDSKFNEFVLNYLVNADPTITATDASMQSFCRKLLDGGLEHLIPQVLYKRVGVIHKTSDFEHFIKSMHEMQFIKKDDIAAIYQFIDKKITLSKDNMALARQIQRYLPRGVVCKNSAHVYAIEIIADSHRQRSITDSLNDLVNQGFPSETSQDYIETLINTVLKANLRDDEQYYLLNLLFSATNGYFAFYVRVLLSVASKQHDKWNCLLNFSAHNKAEKVYNGAFRDIVYALVDSNQNEKSLDALGNLLKDKNSVDYYDQAAKQALEKIKAKKQKSGLGRLFGGVFGSGEDQSNKNKKK